MRSNCSANVPLLRPPLRNTALVAPMHVVPPLWRCSARGRNPWDPRCSSSKAETISNSEYWHYRRPLAGFCFCSPTTSSVLGPARRFGRLELVEVQECMQRHDRVIKDVDSEAFTVEVCRCMQRSPELRLCYPAMCKFWRAPVLPVLPGVARDTVRRLSRIPTRAERTGVAAQHCAGWGVVFFL